MYYIFLVSLCLFWVVYLESSLLFRTKQFFDTSVSNILLALYFDRAGLDDRYWNWDDFVFGGIGR